jgi:hypothetical protein
MGNRGQYRLAHGHLLAEPVCFNSPFDFRFQMGQWACARQFPCRQTDRAPDHSLQSKNCLSQAGDVPSAKIGTGETSCSNVLGSLPKSSDPVSSERSLSRKKTWAVETFVHCKNNPQQTMTSLSIDKNEVLLQGLIPWFERSRWIRTGSWGCDDCAWTLLPARFGSGNRLLELSQQRSRP